MEDMLYNKREHDKKIGTILGKNPLLINGLTYDLYYREIRIERKAWDYMEYVNQKFVPEYKELSTPKEDAWILLFTDKKLLMKNEYMKYRIPEYRECKVFLSENLSLEYIGSYDGHDSYCADLYDITDIQSNYETVNIREITKLTGDPELFLLAGNANHILHWRRSNRFCGCCGHKTEDKMNERAVVCPACGNIVYPRISPATITAIFHEDKILLAHNHNFREGLYSLIAGYVEPGETLEHCVEREIKEEVGIKVKNIKYWNSQPWPYPDSLMLAFTAEYESGDIVVDNCEIIDADWFAADQLPEIPTTDSIAGKMIRWFREER